MRWARELLASGRAEPADIAIASATAGEYDDHLFALRAATSTLGRLRRPSACHIVLS